MKPDAQNAVRVLRHSLYLSSKPIQNLALAHEDVTKKKIAGQPGYRLSMLIPVKSCATSRISLTPKAVWTLVSSSWFAASHM